MVLVHSMALALFRLIARVINFCRLRNTSLNRCDPGLNSKSLLNPELLAPQVLHVLVPDGAGAQHGARAVPADRGPGAQDGHCQHRRLLRAPRHLPAGRLHPIET